MKKRLVLFIALVVFAGLARAQIVLQNTGNTASTITWTLIDLDSTNCAVSTGNASVTGSVSGYTNFTASHSFSVTAAGLYGWSTAGAKAATNDFGTYLSGLGVGGIGALAGGEFGVDSSNAPGGDSDYRAVNGQSEAMVLTFNTSGLSAGSTVSLDEVALHLFAGTRTADFLVYDVSSNKVIEAQWGVALSGTSFTGTRKLENGDKIVIATDASNTTKWRITSLVLDAVAGPPDTDPPSPDPAEWEAVPAAVSPFVVSMTASAGSDGSGLVEYYFDETSGNPGGTDSGWQTSPSYTDSLLQPLTEYSYTVMMRDAFGNSGTVSSVASVTTPAPVGRTNGPPNVVVFFADDLGYADLGHNASPGSLVRTPNIDRICDAGIYLSNYMTHHVCSPSRAGLLTGRHYTEVGVGAQTGGTLDNSIPNIAKDFKTAGYATACFGKWHNSSSPNEGGEGVNAYGFDEFQGYYGGGHNYHTRIGAGGFNWWINDTYATNVTEGYTTYIIRDASLDFIDQNATNTFFLYIPNECIHAPYDVLNTDLEEMCDIVDDVDPSLAWSIVKELASPTTGNKVGDVLKMECSGGDEFDKDAIDLIHPGFAHLVYYAMIHAMDKSTQEILDRLEAYGLTTNTIVVFTSDNGGTMSGDNYPFRGFKHELYEGGVHVPAAVYWPGHLDAHTAPYSPGDNVYTNLTQYFDWYPTMVSMAGQTVTAAELDGINLTPHLFDRTPARPDEYVDSYYGVDDSWAAIRTQRWKLHYNRVPPPNQVLELYDLVNDIGETTNVQASYPTERDTLIGMMDDWFASGDVTATYYPLLGAVIPPYLNPTPSGDILEIQATQTNSFSNPDTEGVYIRYGKPTWLDSNLPYDGYVHAGDIFQYDIYVAEDSEQVSGMFVSPTSGATPQWNSVKGGITLDGELVMKKVLPKGQWVRILCGMGEIAPNSSYANHVALHNPDPGYYHFYIDNVVIRRNDGTIRGVVYSDRSDTSSKSYNADGYSSIVFNNVTLDALPADPGSGYNAWAQGIGGLDGYDPAEAGPTNTWSILTEYGLGSDPTTYTAGLVNSTNHPTSGELGTYHFENLWTGSAYRDYMTLSFDFNRGANDIEIVLSESSNMTDWVESVVLRPPYADTSVIATNQQVVDVADNPGGYPVDTTRITARGGTAIDDAPAGFLKLEVRPLVAAPDAPADLNADVYNGILLEWSGSLENGEYIVERAISGSGSYAELVRTGRAIYMDTSAVGGTAYDYRVRAVNAAGATAWSNVATITR